MNTPTKSGWYWAWFFDEGHAFEICYLDVEDANTIFRTGSSEESSPDAIRQWGPKIELPQEDDSEYLQNYIDPLRDPDRLWNV